MPRHPENTSHTSEVAPTEAPLVASSAPNVPQQEDKLTSEWQQWMQQPGNRAGLVQFGLQLMQPVAFGQNALGHFGQAVGSGLEAKDRGAAIDAKAGARDEASARADRRVDIAEKRASRTKGKSPLSFSALLTQQRRGRQDRGGADRCR